MTEATTAAPRGLLFVRVSLLALSRFPNARGAVEEAGGGDDVAKDTAAMNRFNGEAEAAVSGSGLAVGDAAYGGNNSNLPCNTGGLMMTQLDCSV
jgi:hypothetical protein